MSYIGTGLNEGFAFLAGLEQRGCGAAAKKAPLGTKTARIVSWEVNRWKQEVDLGSLVELALHQNGPPMAGHGFVDNRHP